MGLIKKTTYLTACQFTCYGLSFLRNLVFARALSKSDFALISVFAMTITFIELGGRMAFGQQIVQSKNGDDPRFQGTCQGLLLILGLAASIVLFTTALPLASLFGVPENSWMFRCLAVIPLIRSFEHHDHHWLKRTYDFKATALSETIPHIVVTLAIIAAYPLIEDASAILWVIIGRASFTILLTHYFSKRKYSITFEKKYLRPIVLFSWPLALNGFLHFASTQADQFLIGTKLNLEALSIYAVATSFTILPFFIFAPVINTIMLPKLSRLQNTQVAFRESFYSYVNFTFITASIILLPSTFIIQYAIPLLYGDKYQNIGHIVTILLCACTLRIIRTTQGVADIAKGVPLLQLLSNSIRALSIPISLILFFIQISAEMVAYANLAAEILAFIFTAGAHQKMLGIPLAGSIRITCSTIVSIGITLLISYNIKAETITEYLTYFAITLFVVIITHLLMAPKQMGVFIRNSYRLIKTKTRIDESNG